MKFQAAYSYLKRGHAIALPEWGGFWRWNNETKSIDMHRRNGQVMDLRSTEDLDYTLSFMFRDDWVLVKCAGETEHVKNREAVDADTDNFPAGWESA
ncbi:hypothetical protein [Ectothiorhodospira shaposhnikovii]|uniref:hypothetical protein n=1 Tax=Ectothiorhodospira shaposhnikovii TaxID=1054 RepID=UPI001EE7E032|nr:hypothetical protein [Ectothiorhodospira shaposhnikovii]MCG5512844.1 hypothetical protein [Ectothiorhodospira shaposhnikovii]